MDVLPCLHRSVMLPSSRFQCLLQNKMSVGITSSPTFLQHHRILILFQQLFESSLCYQKAGDHFQFSKSLIFFLFTLRSDSDIFFFCFTILSNLFFLKSSNSVCVLKVQLHYSPLAAWRLFTFESSSIFTMRQLV